MTTMIINSSTATSTISDKKIDQQQAIRKYLKALINKMSLVYQVYNERRALKNISEDMLADLGLTRAEVNKECKRSMLDIPTNRK